MIVFCGSGRVLRLELGVGVVILISVLSGCGVSGK